MQFDWSGLFDQIYCIHYLPRHDERFGRINAQLGSIGVLDSGIFQWEYTFDSPFFQTLRSNVRCFHRNVEQNQGAFNCALAHYCVYKKALGLGYRRILVFEEDIAFMKDKDMFFNAMRNTPGDADVCLYDRFHGDMARYMADASKQNLACNAYYRYFDDTCRGFQSGAFYGISAKAMSQFASEQEKTLHCPDELWNKQGNPEVRDIVRAYAIVNLGVQIPFGDAVNSDDSQILYRISQIDMSKYEIV